VYLVPGWHGKGLGTALLRAGSSWMRDHYQDVTQLRATIKRDNAASLEAFENAGYRLGSHDYMLDLRHG
jgi:RimJ/RimL family protein N-acetyltransferase